MTALGTLLKFSILGDDKSLPGPLKIIAKVAPVLEESPWMWCTQEFGSMLLGLFD